MLALVDSEKGHERMIQCPSDGLINAVNRSEAAAWLGERGLSEPSIWDDFHGLGLEVMPFDEGLAYHARRRASRYRP